MLNLTITWKKATASQETEMWAGGCECDSHSFFYETSKQKIFVLLTTSNWYQWLLPFLLYQNRKEEMKSVPKKANAYLVHLLWLAPQNKMVFHPKGRHGLFCSHSHWYLCKVSADTTLHSLQRYRQWHKTAYCERIKAENIKITCAFLFCEHSLQQMLRYFHLREKQKQGFYLWGKKQADEEAHLHWCSAGHALGIGLCGQESVQ